MRIAQYVMAYGVEQDRLRAILPEGFSSLRPVLRINAEIRGERAGYLELNTAVQAQGKKGWLNIGYWEEAPFVREGKTVTFRTDFLEISFTATGLAGGCPAERDNQGCFFLADRLTLRKPERVESRKEFCDCTFRWSFTAQDAHGASTGETLPAYPSESRTIYPKRECTAKNAAEIACEQVLGAYVVTFER